MRSTRSPMKNSKLRSQLRKKHKAEAYIKKDDHYEQQIQKKLTDFKNHERFKFIKNSLIGFLGKNYTIDYKNHYCFQEQWQSKQQGYQSKTTYMLYENNITLLISFVVMMVYALTIWARSIEFIFILPSEARVLTPIYYFTIFCQACDAGVKLWLRYKQDKSLFMRQILATTYSNLISIVYLCICVAQAYNKVYAIWWALEGINIYFLYGRASQLYQQLRLKNFALKFQYQFKLFDLILNLIIIAHIFAVILFMAGNSGYENSWILELNLQHEGPFVKYLYAFYFCTTTILTVGYGDITPKNHLEVGVVVGVEIFGIVMFGYLLNEIGYTVNILRRNRQVVQKDLVTLDKMRHYYKIDEDLMEKGRTYLINQCDRADHLSPEEENSLMLKFNEDLRNKIYMENSLSVIKSSIFFLCRWSKSMQTAVSTRLQHILFAPEEIIYQPIGKERLYIIRMGKMEVFAEKKGSRKTINNSLKTIQVGLSKEVSDNTYGLTAVISSRKMNLNAVAKSSTSCYYIDKDKLTECIYERMSDFEYFHEIKLRYELQNCPQALEVPQIKNSKHHFDPSIRSTIRRHNILYNTIVNKRRRHIRSNKCNFFEKHKLFLDNKHVERLNTLIYKSMQMIPTTQYRQDEIVFDENSGKSSNNDDTYLREIIKSNIDNQSDHYIETLSDKKIKANLHHFFQTGKDYTNYFMFSNKYHVLRKMELQYHIIANEQISKINTELRI